MQSLVVLTWNLGRLHLGSRVNSLLAHDSRADDKALAHVAGLIRRTRADVVSLQELRSESQLGWLREALGESWRAVAAPGQCDRVVGLLVRGRESGKDRGRERMAPSSVALGGGRDAAAMWEPNARLWMLAAHLEAFDAAARATQIKALIKWVDVRCEMPLVIAGDFNVDPANSLAARLTMRESDRRSWRSLVEERGFCDAGIAAGATAMFGRRIDHVLVRGARVASARVLRGERVWLGDHEPVLARLSFDSVSTPISGGSV